MAIGPYRENGIALILDDFDQLLEIDAAITERRCSLRRYGGPGANKPMYDCCTAILSIVGAQIAHLRKQGYKSSV